VAWESQHITQELYNKKKGGGNKRIVPILLEDETIDEAVPWCLQKGTTYRLYNELEKEEYKKLYRLLTGHSFLVLTLRDEFQHRLTRWLGAELANSDIFYYLEPLHGFELRDIEQKPTPCKYPLSPVL